MEKRTETGEKVRDSWLYLCGHGERGLQMRSGTGHWSGVDLGQHCRGSQGQVAGDVCTGRRTSGDKVRDWWLELCGRG